MIVQPRRHRRWLRWTIGSLVGLLVLVVGGVSLSIHLSTAPSPLALPKDGGSGTAAAATVDGVWNAGAGSIAGWRLQQIVIGQQSTLVGRTGKVWGSLTVSGGSVSQGTFGVDMTAATSGLSKTSQRSVFDVSAYPTATLTLTSPIEVGTIPTDGTAVRLPASGDLTLHGVTRPVTFTVSAERAGSGIDVLADISFPFADWNISVQGVPWLADLQSPGTIEVLLDLTQGQGNPGMGGS